MKSIKHFLRGTILFLSLITFFSTCETQILPVLSSSEDITEWVNSSKRIANAGETIIENAIAGAYAANELVDVNAILESVNKITEVKKAKLSSDGTDIDIEKKDGTFMSLSIVKQNDRRMFIPVNSTRKREMTDGAPAPCYSCNGATGRDTVIHLTAASDDCTPAAPKNGRKKRMLILEPFSEFQSPNADIKASMEKLNFDVDLYINEKADISKFKGDFMSQYDFVLINSHGGIVNTIGGQPTTAVLTGTPYDEALTGELLHTLAHDGKRFGFTTQQLRATTTKKDAFKGTHVFVSACRSSQLVTGEASLGKAFLDLGADSYTGFSGSIFNPLCIELERQLFQNLTGCEIFDRVVDNTKNSTAINRSVYQLRLKHATAIIDAEMLTHEANSETSPCNRFCDKGKEEEDRYNELVPPELENALTQLGLSIHRGTTPPDITGYYRMDSWCTKSSITDDIFVGHLINQMKINFYDQTGINVSMNGYQVEPGTDNFIVRDEATGTLISGSDNKFSVFFNTTTQWTSGPNTISIYVYSGEIVKNGQGRVTGIKNMQLALLMRDNAGRTDVIDNGQGRLFEDDFAEVITKDEYERINMTTARSAGSSLTGGAFTSSSTDRY